MGRGSVGMRSQHVTGQYLILTILLPQFNVQVLTLYVLEEAGHSQLRAGTHYHSILALYPALQKSQEVLSENSDSLWRTAATLD